MAQRSFDEFVKVHPEAFLVTRDRLAVETLQECKPEDRDLLAEKIQHELLSEPARTPRIPNGGDVLGEYVEASSAASMGIQRAVVLYLACQWAMRSNPEQTAQKAKELGFRFDLSRATLSQSMALLDMPDSFDFSDTGAFEKIIGTLQEKQLITADNLQDFGEVANLYAESAIINRFGNWRILQNWLTGVNTPVEKEGEQTIANVIENGSKINAGKLADELVEQAKPLLKLDEKLIAEQAKNVIKNFNIAYPFGCFPETVSEAGFDVHIALGNSMYHDNFVNSVYAGRNFSETMRGYKFDARGVCIGEHKKIMVSTGNLEATESGVKFDVERFKRTYMEEMFHAAEGSTFIKVGSQEYNPRDLIDRNQVHKWTAALEANSKSPKIAEVIRKYKLENHLPEIAKNIDTHLMLEGTHSADELGKMSFDEKLVALSNGIINLHSGYEGGNPISRNAETLVRMHRVFNITMMDANTGLNAYPLLEVMMPELYGLYTKVIMPEMIKQEAKIVVKDLFGKIKEKIKSWKNSISLKFAGGIEKLSGMDEDQILANKMQDTQELREYIAESQASFSIAAPALESSKGKKKEGKQADEINPVETATLAPTSLANLEESAVASASLASALPAA